jgi:protein TonB
MMEGNMFRETLLESAPSSRKRKRWPMVMAFTAEVLVAGLLVMLPLLSTGVISVSAHVPLVAPLRSVTVVDHVASRRATSAGQPPAAHTEIVAFNNNPNNLTWGSRRSSDEDREATPYIYTGPVETLNMPATCTACPTPAQPHPPQVRPSVMSEGHLINRVEPVYPKIAMLTGTQGAVKLHAIIAKDGNIESLSVVSGHPMLAAAAVDAVRQWRYRPYYLNGEPVEVETFITVNFKKTND